ncbi:MULTISPECIES: hypothetical protein [unclassified Kaistella]|uniref:hypothetical protein n=1 Tax=unclassified Kaistella TaxID=2762626 RepID=UPI0027342749|nr:MULTISPECIES: hypothetical protein [unclassified Kaistella]MDP2452492.1 hypothetical protein [Kaistella sp. SH11-4b]MDP2455400.1 hypothetical protein [Kaistella sp. SH40-3]MDP2458304.1 hypothetical protein [Kaistella sp. SH19-2b]
MKLSEIYKKGFENQCFVLLVDAYNTSLSEKIIQLNWEENDISQELYEKIDADPQRLKWNITPFREFYLPQNIKKEKGFANKLSRIDLRMSTISGNLEYKYFCEAKRLKKADSKLKRGYINEGMDRFIFKKYPMGCMLGYVLEGDIDGTLKGINSLLEKDGRNIETLEQKSCKLLKDYFESHHAEIGTLKHMFFNFGTI